MFKSIWRFFFESPQQTKFCTAREAKELRKLQEIDNKRKATNHPRY